MGGKVTATNRRKSFGRSCVRTITAQSLSVRAIAWKSKRRENSFVNGEELILLSMLFARGRRGHLFSDENRPHRHELTLLIFFGSLPDANQSSPHVQITNSTTVATTNLLSFLSRRWN